MAESDGAAQPAQAIDAAPRLTPWRIGGFAVAGSLLASLLLHLALVGGVLLVGPRLLRPEPAYSVTVDLVTDEELAAMAAKAQQSSAETQTQLPFQSQPQSQSNASAAPAAQQSAPTQAQAAAPPAGAQMPPGLDAFAPPVASQSAPAQSAPVAPLGSSSTRAEQLAELLGLPALTAGPTGGGPSEFKANLTSEEISAFTAHVQSCWSAPAGVANAAKLKIVVRVALRADGRLAAEPALIAAPASLQGPAVVKSAMVALQQCGPYNVLPAKKYDQWRLLDLTFTPSGITTATRPRNPS